MIKKKLMRTTNRKSCKYVENCQDSLNVPITIVVAFRYVLQLRVYEQQLEMKILS